MAPPLNCCSQCGAPTTINVQGLQGQSAFTATAEDFLVPALGGPITILVTNSDFAAVGETLFIAGAGTFVITAIPDSTHLALTYSNIPSNTAAGNTITSGALVTPTGTSSNGTNGVNSFTTTTASFVIPAIGANVSNPDGFVHVGNNTWASVGQVVFISDGTDFGSFRVISKPDAISFVAQFLGQTGDSAPGATIDSGASVSPGGNEPPLAGALPTDFTDNSTGTPSNTIAVGVGVRTIEFPHTFIGGTSAVEPVTNYTMGHAFKIISWAFVTEVLLVGAAGSRVANMEINATDVGTVPSTITIPIANAAVGTVTAGTAVAGANTGGAGDTISIEIAAGGTAFTAGSGTFILTIQNTDEANAIASLAAHVDTLIVALT